MFNKNSAEAWLRDRREKHGEALCQAFVPDL